MTGVCMLAQSIETRLKTIKMKLEEESKEWVRKGEEVSAKGRLSYDCQVPMLGFLCICHAIPGTEIAHRASTSTWRCSGSSAQSLVSFTICARPSPFDVWY